MINLFKRTSVQSVMQDQLYEAERQAVEHQASAEHHEALAVMYRARAARLRDQLGYDRKEPGDVLQLTVKGDVQ